VSRGREKLLNSTKKPEKIDGKKKSVLLPYIDFLGEKMKKKNKICKDLRFVENLF